jgi:hypothetical protein
MDMSTPSTAQSLDGAVDASVFRKTSVVRDARERDDLGEPDIAASLESTNEVPMQFVRLGLPAAIFLWLVIGLVAYGAYRFFAG